ncbi:MAG: DNA replication and repair protein RecF [Symploca sp. SIO2D2]|nr:DNA replication and repair protein RecF [Symploca sp. SIO2D2]
MKIRSVGVQNYRNIALARLDLDSPRVFFVGNNGEGKTNLLEALGCITSLRAFRTRENKTLIGPDHSYSEIAYDVEHEELGDLSARIRVKQKGKEAWIDDQPAKRVSDFVSRFPTVVLSSNDLMITRGSPGVRRRLLDNFLCGASREYFVALQSYSKALQERNALLKKGMDAGVLRAFEAQMGEPAAVIYTKRKQAIADLLESSQDCYSTISGEEQSLGIEYRPNLEIGEPNDFQDALDKNRSRDEILHSTSKGPHRDDFSITLGGLPTADFASEGQQRLSVLALSLAIIRYWQQTLKVSPVVLADDVLGELDSQRRKRFWQTMDPQLQFIATGTQLPEDGDQGDWKIYRVSSGCFERDI